VIIDLLIKMKLLYCTFVSTIWYRIVTLQCCMSMTVSNILQQLWFWLSCQLEIAYIFPSCWLDIIIMYNAFCYTNYLSSDIQNCWYIGKMYVILHSTRTLYVDIVLYQKWSLIVIKVIIMFFFVLERHLFVAGEGPGRGWHIVQSMQSMASNSMEFWLFWVQLFLDCAKRCVITYTNFSWGLKCPLKALHTL